MSESSPGPAPFFGPRSEPVSLSSVYPAPSTIAVPAGSPTRRRATSVPAQREADVPLSASPSASPSPSPLATAASLAAPAPLAEPGVSQPPTPVATLSYHRQQPDTVPTLYAAKLRAPPPLPLSASELPRRPSATPPLFPRTPPPSQPSAGAVRLLLPSAAAVPFASLFPSPPSSPSPSAYHQRRLFGRQRHTVVQGELLQVYLIVPHTQHGLFPWLFVSATPPPPASPTSHLPSPPVLVSEVSPCLFHVDVRLRVASLRTDECRDETDASPPPATVPYTATAAPLPSAAPVPQPPTSLSLSSASSLTSASEPANATSGWSRFATRFGRKSGPSLDKDSSSSAVTTSAISATAASSSSSVTTSTTTAPLNTILPAPVTSANSTNAAPQASSPPLMSPQSAPTGVDGSSVARPEPRRTRSLGVMPPTHIPPHVIVASHSAFQHEPPIHLLPHRPTSLTCSPALHHTNSAASSGCYQFTLSNGDVVLVMETIMHASSDGHVWLEVEVHSPTSHQSLLSSFTLPAVSAAAFTSSSLSPQLPSMAASLRSFMSDHRVLRLPPPHPLAGCLLLISHAVHVHASVQQVNDHVLAEVHVKAQHDVRVESIELLTESTRWLSGAVAVPLALSALFSLSMLPASLPLSLCACEEYHFLFVLEPVVCMPHSIAQLRADVLKAMGANEVGIAAVDSCLLTTCVVQWRSEHASTAITSQYDVSWHLPLHVQSPTLSPSSVAAPPSITLSHPPRVSLHSVFAITVTLHNTSQAALTCTLQLPSNDIELAATASHVQPPALVRSHSSLTSGQSTPNSLLPPVSSLLDRSTTGQPFSPVHGFHFPFHSLASRLSNSTLQRHPPATNGHIVTQKPAPLIDGEEQEDERAVQQGLVCLDGEVEVGVLVGGGRCSVGLQCVAVRGGFVHLPRLLLRVKELEASFVCRNAGLLLVDTGT